MQAWTELQESEQQRLASNMFLDGDVDPVFSASPETHEKVARALMDELKPTIRAAFILREVEGRDYQEVAELLNISELAARVRLSRARAEILKKFRAYLATA